MSDSRQLEREAEETRLQLSRTLGELRERITPGQLLDEAIDYARESGGWTQRQRGRSLRRRSGRFPGIDARSRSVRA